MGRFQRILEQVQVQVQVLELVQEGQRQWPRGWRKLPAIKNFPISIIWFIINKFVHDICIKIHVWMKKIILWKIVWEKSTLFKMYINLNYWFFNKLLHFICNIVKINVHSKKDIFELFTSLKTYQLEHVVGRNLSQGTTMPLPDAQSSFILLDKRKKFLGTTLENHHALPLHRPGDQDYIRSWTINPIHLNRLTTPQFRVQIRVFML